VDGGKHMGRRKKGYRTKKVTHIEGMVKLVFLAIAVLASFIKLMEHVFNRMYSLFSSFGFKEWSYVFLCLLFLGYLYYLALKREKEMEKVNMQKRQEMKEHYKRQQIEKLNAQNKLEELKKMHPFEFERFIKEVYELMGYTAKLTSKTGDGGKDVILKKDGETMLVECKRYNSPKVTRPDIQKFHSALIDMNAKKGFYITTGEFTKPAIEYAKDKAIKVINGEDLILLVQNATKKHFFNNEESDQKLVQIK
jgi:HJR/Mrr/RecB family endonuclease